GRSPGARADGHTTPALFPWRSCRCLMTLSMSTRPTSNYDFLADHDPRLVVLGAEAERQFAEFPVACIGTLRRFGEILAQRAAAKVGVLVDPREAQADVLSRLAQRGALPFAPREL